MTLSMVLVPLVVVGTLEETYTLRGIEMWWTSRNSMLDDQTPQGMWAIDPQRVVDVATQVASAGAS